MADQDNIIEMITEARSDKHREYGTNVTSVNAQLHSGPSTRSRHGYKARGPERYSNTNFISSSQDKLNSSRITRSRTTSSRGSTSTSIKTRSRSTSSSSVVDKHNRNPFTALKDMAIESDGENSSDSEKPCNKCGGSIDEGVKALQCEFCANWSCLHCTEVPENMYDLLMDKDAPGSASFLWSCHSCIHAIPTIKNLGRAMQGIRDEQSETKVELGKLKLKVDNLESSIEVKVQEAIEAYRDRESRKCNVIIHNIPESKKLEAKERREEDLQEVGSLLEEGLELKDFQVQSIVRLGKRMEDKHRLIKVTVESVKTKREILSKTKKLKNDVKWSRTFVTPDLTPTERNRSKLLREELKRRKAAGEEGLVIRRGLIVKVDQEADSTSPAASKGPEGGVGVGLFR